MRAKKKSGAKSAHLQARGAGSQARQAGQLVARQHHFRQQRALGGQALEAGQLVAAQAQLLEIRAADQACDTSI